MATQPKTPELNPEALDLFICSICKEDYTDPRLLRCGHSFCLSCLEQWARQRQNQGGRQIVCPTCKEITPLIVPRADNTGSAVQLLPKDFKINQIKQAFSGVNIPLEGSIITNSDASKCKFCTVNGTSYICLTCDKSMCQECHDKHKSKRLFKGHSIEVVTEKSPSDFPECEAHVGEVIRYFCLTCGKAMCTLCAMDTKHESHDTTSLLDGLEQCKSSLKSLLQPVLIRQETNNALLLEVECARSEMDTSLIRSKELLQRTTDELVAQVQQWETNMQTVLQTKYNNALTEMNKYIMEVNKEQDTIQNVADSIDSLDTDTNAIQVIAEKSGEIKEQLQQIASTEPLDYLQLNIHKFKYPVKQPGLIGFLNTECPSTDQSICISNYDDVVVPTNATIIQEDTNKLVWSISKRSAAAGDILSPISVSFTSEEYLLVCEVDSSRIQIFDIMGTVIGKIPSIFPKDAVADSDGKIYVTDSTSNEILIFKSSGELISRWGKGVLKSPRSLAIADNECIVVVDKESCKITVHTKTGETLQSSPADDKGLLCPVSVCVDSQGRIIVADRELNQVLIYNGLCQWLMTISPEMLSTTLGTHLQSVCVDDSDNIYMCMHSEQRILKYNPAGKFIKVVLSSDDGLKWPTGIACGPHGYFAVVESKVPRKHSALKLFKFK